MKDNVPKGTGNSRYLKSAISSSTTWEQFRTMLVNGTLPIDLNGINAAGWQVLGDALNKANLLPDSLASALGLTGNPQVKDALAKLYTTTSVKSQSVAGTYTGTGTFGADNPCSITLGFKPQLFVILLALSTQLGDPASSHLFYAGQPGYTSAKSESCVVTPNNSGITWYSARSSPDQMNTTGTVYYYVALGKAT